MSEDGLFLPRSRAHHPRHRTPDASSIAQCIWGVTLALTGSYEQLLSYVVFAVFVFHTLTGAAVIVLRKARPLHSRPYRVWGYPWVPLLFTISSFMFVVNTFLEKPRESLLGAGCSSWQDCPGMPGGAGRTACTNALAVKSIGPRWSVGGKAMMESSTYRNLKRSVFVAPAEEVLGMHALTLAASARQPWGQVNVSVDLSRLSVDGRGPGRVVGQREPEDEEGIVVE